MIYLAKRLGRYANIVLFAFSLVVLVAWFPLLDAAPLIFFALSPLVILICAAAYALLVGMLFVRLPDDEEFELSRDAAPLLWKIWDEFEPEFSGHRSLHVGANLNASISERKKWFGLFGRSYRMTLGLELLILADEKSLRAVMAHEVGHARCQHTAGATNLVEFLETFDTLFSYADPETTITGRVADWLLGSWLNRAQGELMRVSRQNELEADKFAADVCGVRGCTDAEVLVAVTSDAVEKLIYGPMEKEMLGAIRAPSAPFQRVREQRQMLLSEATQQKFLGPAWEKDVDENSSHPPFRTRFENLCPGEEPTVIEVGPSSAEICLPPETLVAIVKHHDMQWTEFAEQEIGIY